MLSQVAEGVLTHQSGFCQSNAVVVQGADGVLLVDPGVQRDEMLCLATDLRELKDLRNPGQPVVAGFSTHPHWDHQLWHAELGPAPRYGTARCAAAIRTFLSDPQWKTRIVGLIPPDIAGQVPLDLLGRIDALPAETARIPWDGPRIRIIEHQAHASGHAALLVEERGVLVAGDMLSDVLVPMLDLMNSADPVGDYLAALTMLEAVADDVDAVVPGHGSVCAGDEMRARIERDRAYLYAVRDGRGVDDPRIGPAATYAWVSDVHARQVQVLAQKAERDGPRG